MDNESFDTLIIGAGAAGLMAMHDLTKAGRRVCLLEATHKAGGRMATEMGHGFTGPVEKGAEFVHGALPLTLSLLDKAGIAYSPVEGDMIAIENGRWNTGEAHDKYWELFMQRINDLATDMSIGDVLTTYFANKKYDHLRDAVQRYAEGHGNVWQLPEQCDRVSDLHITGTGGSSNLQPAFRDLQRSAISEDHRYDTWSEYLLHNRRLQPGRQQFAFVRTSDYARP